jgi:hypothetical protein
LCVKALSQDVIKNTGISEASRIDNQNLIPEPSKDGSERAAGIFI